MSCIILLIKKFWNDKIWKWSTDEWLPGSRKPRGWLGVKGQQEILPGSRRSYLVTVHANTLAVVTCYRFSKGLPLCKLGKQYIEPFCIIGYRLYANVTWSKIKKKFNKKINQTATSFRRVSVLTISRTLSPESSFCSSGLYPSRAVLEPGSRLAQAMGPCWGMW